MLLAAAFAAGAHSAGRPRDAREGPDPELREILLTAIKDADSFEDRFDAEVWLTDMSRRLVAPSTRRERAARNPEDRAPPCDAREGHSPSSCSR